MLSVEWKPSLLVGYLSYVESGLLNLEKKSQYASMRSKPLQIGFCFINIVDQSQLKKITSLFLLSKI